MGQPEPDEVTDLSELELSEDQDLDAPDELERAVAALQSTVGGILTRVDALEKGKPAPGGGAVRVELDAPVFLSEGARADAENLDAMADQAARDVKDRTDVEGERAEAAAQTLREAADRAAADVERAREGMAAARSDERAEVTADKDSDPDEGADDDSDIEESRREAADAELSRAVSTSDVEALNQPR